MAAPTPRPRSARGASRAMCGRRPPWQARSRRLVGGGARRPPAAVRDSRPGLPGHEQLRQPGRP
eukprot:11842620-Alexandrium_andersonii.AAC.1